MHESLSKYLQEIVAEVGREDIAGLCDKSSCPHVEMEKHRGRLTLSPDEPAPDRHGRYEIGCYKFGFPLILLLLSPLILIAVLLFYALRLRMLERSDPEIVIRPDRQHIQDLSVQEDRNICNQFNAFGEVKPGLFRLLTALSLSCC